MKKKNKKKTVSTKKDLLGYIFGDPLMSFDPTIIPSFSDLIRVWMYEYDETRGDKRQISAAIKNDIIEKVVDALIDNHKILSRPVGERREIKKLVNNAVKDAQKYETYHHRKNDIDWIKTVHDQFKLVKCDLSPAVPSPRKTSPDVAKPIHTETVSTPLGKRESIRTVRLIEKYPPEPIAKRSKVEPETPMEVSDEIENYEGDKMEIGESEEDENIEIDPTDPDFVYDDSEESDDEGAATIPSYCVHDYTEAVKFGISHRLSIRVITGMIITTAKCLGITDPSMLPGRSTVLNICKKLGIEIRKRNIEKNSNLLWVGVDGRNDKVALPNNKSGTQENVSIINALTGKYADHVIPEDHKGETLAKEIYGSLKKLNSTESVAGVNIDNCPTNTGQDKGAIYFLEHKYLKRKLMRNTGLLHLNELLLRHFMVDNCGFITSGPYDFADPLGKIVKRLKNNLKPITDFPPIPTNLPSDIPAKLLTNTDQQYMVNILMAISKGPSDLIFSKQAFVYKNPGEIGHARWLTICNNASRLLTQMTPPERGKLNEMKLNTWKYNKLKRVVTFCSQAYGPNFIKIKMYPDIKNAPQHFLDMIKLSKSVCTEDEFYEQKKGFQK